VRNDCKGQRGKGAASGGVKGEGHDVGATTSNSCEEGAVQGTTRVGLPNRSCPFSLLDTISFFSQTLFFVTDPSFSRESGGRSGQGEPRVGVPRGNGA
jgi:hypothetical protein